MKTSDPVGVAEKDVLCTDCSYGEKKWVANDVWAGHLGNVIRWGLQENGLQGVIATKESAYIPLQHLVL